LKLNRRGVLAVNESGTFILSLIPLPHLDEEFSVIGCIQDQSIYNLLDISTKLRNKEIVHINSAKVVQSYFDDLVASNQEAKPK
jgi:stalled ribosome rescue protein Dom34